MDLKIAKYISPVDGFITDIENYEGDMCKYKPKFEIKKGYKYYIFTTKGWVHIKHSRNLTKVEKQIISLLNAK